MTMKPGPGDRPPINLYSMNPDGNDLRMLAEPLEGFTQIGSGEWSADGTKIIADMSKGPVETSRVVILNSDGSGLKDLGPGCMPSLSPDNSEVVFSQPGTGIMRMQSDGSDRKLIDPNGWGTQWSPDGRLIAWASGNNVVLLDTKTNERRRLMTSAQSAQLGYVYWNLGWSQNSTSIAFKARSSDRTSTLVAVADADSAEGFRIVYSASNHINEDFTWHPDGQRVVFSFQDQPGNASRLVMVDRGASAVPESLPGQLEGWNNLGCDWSPDGSQIAFSSHLLPQPAEWPPRGR
ncbi:MAG: PD40 domain-containing protein [Fuerstia sp.]|nr:PD40 domain-containing protein [Fuerstiella sp.]